MPYEYLDDIAVSDVAFRAWGATVEEMFIAAADAMMNAMADDLERIEERDSRAIAANDPEIDMLLFDFLQELIYFKDAEKLLLRVSKVEIEKGPDGYALRAEARGETLDPAKHELLADVKAVTLHRYRVEKTAGRWEAVVIVDT